MRYALLAVVFVLVGSCEVQAQRKAIVCPPHLSYCYEKPVLPAQTDRDRYNELAAQLQADLAAVERRMRSGSRQLDYELSRARLYR